MGGMAILGGVLLQHLVPHLPSRHTIRDGLRSATATHLLPYTARTAKTEATDRLLRSRDEMLAELRQRLLQAQQLSKKYYDANHRD
jgi:hypothetical protein